MNVKTFVLGIVLSLMLSTFTQCDTDVIYRDPEPVKLSLAGFTPGSAVGGSFITLVGTQFDLNPEHNRVMFNGVEAEVTEALPDQLTVIVPADATSGKISLTVNNQTVTSTDEFIIPVPVIRSLIPPFGGVGDWLIVNMKDVPLNKRETVVVKINGVKATIETWPSTNMVRVTVPQNASSGKVTVSLPGQELTSTNDYEVLAGIPYVGLVAFYDYLGFDRTGHFNHGRWYAWTCPDRYGNLEGAYQFNVNYSNQYVSIGNPDAIQLSGAMTLSVWVKAPAFQEGVYLISKASTEPDAFPSGYLLTLQDTDGHPSYALGMPRPGGGQPGESNYLSSAPFVPDVWECIAFTLDENTMTFYKNGVETNRVTNHVRLRNSSDPLVFGRNSYGPFNYYTGMLDDIMIYNRALTPAEIKQLYDQRITSRQL